MAKVTQRKLGDPEILHINLNLAEPLIEELNESPMRDIVVPRYNKHQALYKFDCMNGREHPLTIEREHYMLITIATEHIDKMYGDQTGAMHRRPGEFAEVEVEFIALMQRRPEIEWAVDNSFDGLYVQKYDDYHSMATTFKFAVYLKEEQATFWKLKFHGK